MSATDTAQQPQRLLTMSSGGWVIVLAGLLTLALLAWALGPALLGRSHRPPGDGRHLDSYGFDLEGLLVPRALLVPAMEHRDMVRPLDHPAALPGRDLARINRERGKYVLPRDRVVGVQINGEARAYPVSILNVHEVVHDELGGRPIAVTYHWPCESVMVFDREVAGRVLEFGVSGLLYNSNMLLYDRKPAAGATRPEPGGESLWSQMLARAVSGPAARAGERLTVHPSVLLGWTEWVQLHPDTTLADRDPTIRKRRYAKANPDEYLKRGRIVFPVDPRPPLDGPPPLTRVVAVRIDDRARVYPLPFLKEHADEDGRWSDTLNGVPLRFECSAISKTVRVSSPAPGASPSVDYALWFAWHAMHPEDPLVADASD